MSTKNSNTSQELFNLNGKPSFGQALPLAFQHVVAMIIGCVAPAIILAGVSGLSESDTVVLIQASLAMSAISTFIQLFPFIKFKSYQIGAGLPVIMGISFAYVPIMQSIAQDADVGTILGAQIVGGIVAIIVGIFIKQIRHLFPPLVTGTVVFAIGLSLYPTAVNYMAGGAGSADYGSWQNWLVAIITLVVVTGLNHFGKGFLKLSSVLIGIIVGYVVALGFGMVDFSSVLTAKWVQFPQPMHFGIKFEPSSCVAIAVLFAISSIQAIGDFSATTTGGMDRMPTDEELSGGIIGYGGCGFWRSADGNLQSECRNRKFYESSSKESIWNCSDDHAGCRNHAKDRIHSSNYSVMCAWRRNNFCICNDFHDGYQTDQ